MERLIFAMLAVVATCAALLSLVVTVGGWALFAYVFTVVQRSLGG